MSRFLVRAVMIILALLMLRCEFVLYRVNAGLNGDDFWSYLTGSWGVRSGSTLDLYEAASRNVDASDVVIDPTAIPTTDQEFVRTAQAHAIHVRGLYIYPPTLADLMVPFTFVSPRSALRIWYVMSFAALLGAGILMVRVLGMKFEGRALLVPGFFIIFPAIFDCLTWGQVLLFLLLMILGAINFYIRGRRQSAAFLFALATAIKLTPLIVLVPLIAWRDWKMVRSLALWCLVMLAVLTATNGSGWYAPYFLHEAPRLGTILDFQNRSLNTVIHLLSLESVKSWAASPHALLGHQFEPGPSMWVNRALSAMVICIAGWLSWTRRSISEAEKVETIAAFLLIVCCISPVSWLHAYVLSAPAMTIYGKRIWQSATINRESILFALFAFSFSIPRFDELKLLMPILGIALAITGLNRLKHAGDFENGDIVLDSYPA
jgi:hypothetical protein